MYRLTDDENMELQASCGHSNTHFKSGTNDEREYKVAYGQKATEGQFPWAVAFMSIAENATGRA